MGAPHRGMISFSTREGPLRRDMQMNQMGLYADINGARLYYQVTGEGQSLVLIHGFTLDHRMWDDQVEAVAL